MKLPQLPRGFRVAGVHCGIKKDKDREDLSLFVADRPAVVAGVYTQNLVFAAPIAVDRTRTPSSNARVVVVNSGNANACTGERGLRDANEMCRLAAAACNASAEQVLVMSTGIIGVYLPMPTIASGVTAAAQKLGTDSAAFLSAAKGMMTTDKGPKIAGRTVMISGREVRLAGVCKGAAMIGPRMATMLCVVMTDAAISADEAQQALTHVVNDSFNCISVEGHMSTNDKVLLLASGEAGNAALNGADQANFQNALRELCVELARMIPDDGEGSTHLIHILVRGCPSRDDAHRIAKTVAESSLVKTAITGADPNWGRIVSAAGYSGVSFRPEKVELTVNGHLLFQQGAPVPFNASEVSDSIRNHRETQIVLKFGEGDAESQFWTSDLTVDYVRANSEYTT
jgi:glutamate N-acetyltransferase/amino-acid N-acetyltransferase